MGDTSRIVALDQTHDGARKSMNISDIAQIPGRRFPAGRLSQRLVGAGLPIVAQGFCVILFS
jgi:hypothetical protein